MEASPRNAALQQSAVVSSQPTVPARDLGVTAISSSDVGATRGKHGSWLQYVPFVGRPRLPLLWVSFLICVVLPSLATIVYYSFLASPQYVVEARLIVRQAESSSSAADKLGALASLGGATVAYSSAAQHAYVVAQYIKSRAAVEQVSKLVDLEAIFQREEADFWARLPADAPIEELVEYWREMVKAYVESTSNIVIFEVRAFRPADALAVSQAIVEVTEKIVNEMSQRARQDVMRMSENEVSRAASQVRERLRELQRARDEEGILDPSRAADDVGRLLMQLTAEKVRMESELAFATSSLDRSSPRVRELRSRLEIAEAQITQLKLGLAGDSDGARTVASSLRRFEQLEVEKLFAEKLLQSAEDGLERARIKAERQGLYFMVFVPPALPIKATLPYRFSYSALITVTCLLLWGIVALLWAAVEDHRL